MIELMFTCVVETGNQRSYTDTITSAHEQISVEILILVNALEHSDMCRKKWLLVYGIIEGDGENNFASSIFNFLVTI